MTPFEALASMVEPLTEAAAGLGLSVSTRPFGNVDPPALVFGAPILEWGAYDTTPSNASWPIYLVVAKTDMALENLLRLAPSVGAVIEESINAAVLRVQPVNHATLGPAYEFTVEVAL